ncbi:MAG: tetratricopeptide (TPR) repeat protein [Paraglaciecola sp.]|jgi:tetratricopeptide (TPR) repeat protein
MKKLLFSLLSLLLVVGTAIGQEDPAKALKKAARAMSSYNMDTANNGEKLDEAKEMIDIAAADASVAGRTKTWQTKGDIYAAFLKKDMNALVLDPTHVPTRAGDGIASLNAYEKAYELAEKKYEKKDALTGMTDVAKNLNFVGNAQITAKDYASAFATLKAVLDVNSVVKEAGGDAPIADADVNNQKYIIAFCAEVAEEKDLASMYFKELYEAEFDEPGVYSRYFNFLSAEGDKEGALKVLEAGRLKFPDDTEILFAEINYYIQKEEYDILETKLKEAVAAEPENASLRSALGNVYMNLYDGEFAANGETEKGQDYFDSSLDFFNQSIEMDENMSDAIYSVGSLHFNKAVAFIKKQANLSMSKADQKLYEEYNMKIKDLFVKALPYFKKSEVLNANDTNTLLALSEIYARTNEFEMSKEFKARLKVVNEGGQNEVPYFKGK